MPTEVSKQLDRIEGAVGDIKTAIANKGVTVPSGTKIDGLANLVSSISPQLKLQDKSVTPSHSTVSVTADSGYDGLGTVTVLKMPLNYADTSSGDAVAGEILKGKKAWVDGSEVTGTMPNNGAVTGWLGNNAVGFFVNRYNIPAGYHDGSGVVWISGETTSVTPKESPIEVVPKNLNSALQKVTVGAIPTTYVGSGVTKRTSESLTASGATVTAPAGYYAESATKTLTDSNLVADNIKKGVTIFGVTGTHEGGASVTTCTITVTFTTNAGNTLTSATTFANGAFSAFQSTTKSGTFTIQNVVCGSALSIGTTTMCSLYWSGSQQGHQSLYGGMITVPSTSGTYTVEVGVLDD